MKNTLILLAILFAPSVFAQTGLPKGMPICKGYNNKVLSTFDNQKVMKLKQTTQNLYKDIVFVKAKLVSVGQITSNNYGKHLHFIVSLSDGIDDIAHENIIEVSHSMNAYTSPTAADLSAGPIYLCGEYSTTDVNKLPKITKFTPSPTGAMIHWTHLASPNLDIQSHHPHGWIFANGKLFGTYR